jgi:hypothetical protein
MSGVGEYYSALDRKVLMQEQRYVRETDVGLFLPSDLMTIEDSFSDYFRRFRNPLETFFLDAGSGDGRMVYLLAERFGVKGVGIEYDSECTSIAIAAGDSLAVHPRPVFIRGRFEDDKNYAGLDFSAFTTIYHFKNSENSLVNMMMRRSPRGTHFVFSDFHLAPKNFSGFRHIAILGLSEGALALIPHVVSDLIYCHLYEKE